jgi:small nuclear ribonucleoprotein (snRNP)-like protein
MAVAVAAAAAAAAAEAEELVGATVSVLWDENKWYRGTVVGYDGFMHTGAASCN